MTIIFMTLTPPAASVFNTFTPTAKDGLVDTIKRKITVGKLIGDRDGAGTVGEVDTAIAGFSMGDFNGIYAPFSIETNWTGNLLTSNAPVGNLNGDLHFGVFQNGCTGYVWYTQSGWVRNYVNPVIQTGTSLGALIRADLVTTTNWVSSGIFTDTNSGYGDVGQCYQEGNYLYTCVANTTDNVHTWARVEVNMGVDVVIPDASYLPYYVLLLSMTTHSYYDIPANSMISQFSVEATDTNGGTYAIGITDGGTDIASGMPVPTSVGAVKGALLSWFQANPSKTTQSIYLTCSNGAVLNLHLIIQKCLS